MSKHNLKWQENTNHIVRLRLCTLNILLKFRGAGINFIIIPYFSCWITITFFRCTARYFFMRGILLQALYTSHCYMSRNSCTQLVWGTQMYCLNQNLTHSQYYEPDSKYGEEPDDDGKQCVAESNYRRGRCTSVFDSVSWTQDSWCLDPAQRTMSSEVDLFTRAVYETVYLHYLLGTDLVLLAMAHLHTRTFLQ